MWGKVSCLRIQHGGRNWALNDKPSDLKSNMLTTLPPRPTKRTAEKNTKTAWSKIHMNSKNEVWTPPRYGNSYLIPASVQAMEFMNTITGRV